MAGKSGLEAPIPALQRGDPVLEVVFTPVTDAIVGWLKRQENEDWYDRHTDFMPFSLKD